MQANCCFIGWQKKDIYRYGISPNKLGDYFMAGKPVLHAVAAGNDPVAEAKAGLSVEPYNPHQLDRSLRELISMGSEGRNRMGARGRQYALETLEWSVLGKRYENLCQSLIEKSS
jgi:glycosyltransferase involved in cell wall biosynthesis